METCISWQKGFKFRGIITDNFTQCCCQAIQMRILPSESPRLVQFYPSSQEELAKTATKTHNPHDFIVPDNSVNSIVSLWSALGCEGQPRQQMSQPPTPYKLTASTSGSVRQKVGSYHNRVPAWSGEAAFPGSPFDFLP